MDERLTSTTFFGGDRYDVVRIYAYTGAAAAVPAIITSSLHGFETALRLTPLFVVAVVSLRGLYYLLRSTNIGLPDLGAIPIRVNSVIYRIVYRATQREITVSVPEDAPVSSETIPRRKLANRMSAFAGFTALFDAVVGILIVTIVMHVDTSQLPILHEQVSAVFEFTFRTVLIAFYGIFALVHLLQIVVVAASLFKSEIKLILKRQKTPPVPDGLTRRRS